MNRPFYKTTEQPEKSFSTAAGRLQQSENYPLVLLRKNLKKVEMKW